MRVKINVTSFGYSSDKKSFVLPAMSSEEAEMVATAIAKSQFVEENRIGDHVNGEGNVLVMDPARALSVELIQDDAVVTKRQYAGAVAAWEQECARKQAEKATKARELAEATV